MVELRPLDLSARGIHDIALLMRAIYPSHGWLDEAYLDWWYNGNPTGPTLGFNAYADGRLATHMANQQFRARVFGVESRGLHFHNLVTHPDHRGSGLFLRVAEAGIEQAREQGFDFLYGVSNQNSTHGFIRRLDWQLVAPLDARIGIGPAPRPTLAAEVDFERLWDAETLRWRLACPARVYSEVRRGERCHVYVSAGQPGIALELAELDACLVPRTLPAFRSPSPLRLVLGLDPARSFRRAPYVRIPWRMRPSPLNLIYRDLREPGRRLDPGRVRVRAIDFDAF